MDNGYPAQRTSFDIPIVQKLVKAVQSTINYPVILLPSAGGSLPLYLFEKTLKTKVIHCRLLIMIIINMQKMKICWLNIYGKELKRWH